jgi:hypothetical protein
MNKLSLLVGAAIGAMLTAGIAQLQAQAPAATTRPAVFVVTEQTLTDEKKYNDEYAPKVLKTIKDHGGRFIVRTSEVTSCKVIPVPSVWSFSASSQWTKSRNGKAARTTWSCDRCAIRR